MVTQFALKNVHANKVAYFGCLGDDERGKLLEEVLKKVRDSLTKHSQEGVDGTFAHDKETPTGTCAVIVYNKERSLVANLAACLKFPTDHLKQNFAIAEKAKILYTTCFFITANFEALKEVVTYAAKANKPMCLNLSATFLIEFNGEQVHDALQHADYVFCNEDEAASFAKVNKIEYTSLKEIAIAIAKWKKVNEARQRVAIVTQGKEPVLIAIAEKDKEPTVIEVQVPLIDKDQIVDTNGAGDAFVGGFLSQLAQDKDLETCVKCGNYCASEIIKRSGCTFPENCTFQA